METKIHFDANVINNPTAMKRKIDQHIENMELKNWELITMTPMGCQHIFMQGSDIPCYTTSVRNIFFNWKKKV